MPAIYNAGDMFGTFDLGRAYSQAEAIKGSQQDRATQVERTDLLRQKLALEEQDAQALADARAHWEEYQARRNDPVWQEEVGKAARTRFGEGVTNEAALRAVEEDLRLKLKIPAGNDERLVATEKGYLRESDAVGLMPARAPAQPPDELDYRRDRRESARERRDAVKERRDAANERYKIAKEQEVVALADALAILPATDPRRPQLEARYTARTGKKWGDDGFELDPVGAGGGGAPATNKAGGPKEGMTGTSKSGKPTIFRNGRWEYQ